nr:MAG TPA: Malignant T-cell-amplified sequence 1, Density-regulated initiation, Ribosome, TRANSLATION [Caudoviricetes sp.]
MRRSRKKSSLPLCGGCSFPFCVGRWVYGYKE